MSWEAKVEILEKRIKKAFLEEPGLDLPALEQEFGVDDQHDVLDSLIYDALLEEEFPPLPVVDPKIARWIDGLEVLEEELLKSVSNACVQQKPGQQKQLQPMECDICGKRFQFPVNLKRHKWRTCFKAEEKNMESTINQFKDYWEKLEDEKACKVISVKDAVLPADVTELQLNDIIDAVSSHVKASNDEHTSVIAFLLNPEAVEGCPSFQEIFDTLHFLSDGTLFHGRLNPEMQRIVFPHALTMDEIREQGLLASFEFLVEYCLMKPWADDEDRIGNLLKEEEGEAPRKQTQPLASSSKAKKNKPSAAKRRKQIAQKKESSDLSAQIPEDEEADTSKDQEEIDMSLLQLNQSDSKDSCNVAATESSSLPCIVDLPGQEMASENVKGMKPGDVIDEEISTLEDEEGRDRLSHLNQRDSKEVENLTEQDSGNVTVTELSAQPSVDDSLQAIIFPVPHHGTGSERMKGMKPGVVIDDPIIDAGYLSSRQATASTRKTRKHPDALRKKMMQKMSTQNQKPTQDKSFKETEADRLLQLKVDVHKHGEEGATDKPVEVDYRKQASSDVAATLLDLVQSVGNFEQGESMSSAMDLEKVTESTVEGTEQADPAADITDLPSFDDRGSLSETLVLENSGGALDKTGDRAPDINQQEHASSDVAATRSADAAAVPSYHVQSVGDSAQGGITPSALDCKNVTESTIKSIDWADLPDNMNDLPPLPRLKLGGTLDDMADQASASSDDTHLDLVRSVGDMQKDCDEKLVQSEVDVAQEEHDVSSQRSQTDLEESEKAKIDDSLSQLIPEDSELSEENVLNKPSEQHKEQVTTRSQSDLEESKETTIDEFSSELVAEDLKDSEENVIDKPSKQQEQQGGTKNENDFEESKEIVVGESLSQSITEHSEEREENAIDKPSEQHEQEGSTEDAAAAQPDLTQIGGQSVLERLYSAQTLEAAAEVLEEVVWGDFTKEETEFYSRPASGPL